MTSENGEPAAPDPDGVAADGAPAVPTARRNRFIAGGLAVAVVVVLLGTLGDRDSRPPEATQPPTTQADTAVTTGAPSADGPDVPPVDACELLTDTEVEGAMGMLDISSRGLFTFGRSEGCVWQPAVDGDQIEGLFVTIAPGSPDDFADGATLGETPGVVTGGVGEAAVWFAAGDAGTISVVQGTSLGYVFVRVGIARQEGGDAARLEAAKALVAAALPRFPGASPDGSVAPPPLVDLCTLISDEQADEILGPYRGTHPGTLDEVLVTRDVSGEVDLSETREVSCKKLILAEIYVQAEPGSPDDFEPGAAMAGVAGETVAGVGDEAVWFAGVPVQGSFTAPHENGVLSVESGAARFRIRLALPDTGIAAQLDLAKDLAEAALTRIPGVEAGGISIESAEPFDDSGFGYFENLIAKVDAGEWTLGEGLAATLRAFSGETDVTDLLRQPDVVDRSSGAVIQLAEAYAESGTDEAAKVEIVRLLDELFPSSDQLDEITRDNEPEAFAFSAFLVAQDPKQDDFCMKSFGVAAPCLRKETSPELEAKWPDKYRVYRPIAKVANGWTLDKVDLVVDAMRAAALEYETLAAERGGMPKVTIVLTGNQKAVPWTEVADRKAGCVVKIHPPALGLSAPKFQQAIARDIAYCLESRVFADVTGIIVEGGESKLGSQWWWGQGLAIYLSDVVYPDANIEHENLPEWLRNEELSVPLLSRLGRTWAFFEHLHPGMGPDGILDLIGGLPGTLEDVGDEWHPFNQALTDVAVPDVSGKLAIPYKPPSNAVEISGTGEETFAAPPLGVNRLHVQVAGDQKACLSYATENDVEASWRSGPPGETGGTWSSALPEELEGEATFLITATGGGQTGRLADGLLTVTVDDVVDSGEECEPDEPPPPPTDPGCPELICGPSGYFKNPDQLPDFLRRMLGL